MRHAHGYTEHSLPVALELMTGKLEIPAGNAVKLTEHTLSAVLMHCRLTLFCGCKLTAVAEHINTRNTKTAVRTHTITDCGILTLERRLFHHMTGEHNAVFVAPAADIVGKSLCKTLCNMVVVMVACDRNLTVGKLPEKLRQFIKKLFAVHLTVRIGKVGCIGKKRIGITDCFTEHLLACNLRLIGKDCGHSLTEIVTDALFISLVCYVDEISYCGR